MSSTAEVHKAFILDHANSHEMAARAENILPGPQQTLVSHGNQLLPELHVYSYTHCIFKYTSRSSSDLFRQSYRWGSRIVLPSARAHRGPSRSYDTLMPCALKQSMRQTSLYLSLPRITDASTRFLFLNLLQESFAQCSLSPGLRQKCLQSACTNGNRSFLPRRCFLGTLWRTWKELRPVRAQAIEACVGNKTSTVPGVLGVQSPCTTRVARDLPMESCPAFYTQPIR